jgi:CO dehydrogenase maturation factor
MKIAVAGKGGVGKTLISSTLARLLARDGYNVLAIDADPNINLAAALGVPKGEADKIVPISENDILIKEKTGVAPGESIGRVFNMAPKVGDIVEKFGIAAPDGVNLLVMGTVKAGNSGCMCGANALLRALIQHILIQRGEVVVMDMEAGLEHLGRGTARRMDVMLAVVEPSMKAIETAGRVMKLAREIEVKDVIAVGNKVSSGDERNLIEQAMKELRIPVAAYIPFDRNVSDSDMRGTPLIDYEPESPAVLAIVRLKEYLERHYSL